MKTLFLFFTLLLAVSHTSFGQSFAPTGAKWYYSASGNGMAPPHSEYYLYESKQDTTVLNRPCKKIVVSYFKYNGSVDHPAPIITYDAGDTVFYYNTLFSKFIPLYIFNVEKGDTVVYHSPSYGSELAKDTNFRVVVDSVTTFMNGTTPLKRVWTHPLDLFSFWGSYIEKIGGTFLMIPPSNGLIPEGDGPLRCYSDDEIAVNFSGKPCNYLLTTGLDEKNEAAIVSVYPNPVSNVLTIKVATSSYSSYILYNSFGQIVRTGFLPQGETRVHLEELEAGFYQVEIWQTDKMEHKGVLLMK